MPATIALSRPLVGLLLILGDSISAGSGASIPAHSFAQLLHRNDDVARPEAAGHDVLHAFGPQVRLLNWAVPGADVPQIRASLERHVAQSSLPLERGHAIVAITAGGNDFKNAFLQTAMARDRSIEGTAARGVLENTLAQLGALVARLRDPRLFPGGTSIYLADIYDPGGGRTRVPTPWGTFFPASMSAALRQWHAAYARFAEQHDVHLVPAYEGFAGHGFGVPAANGEPGSGSWFADPIHPNDEGHHRLRELFWQALRDAPPAAALPAGPAASAGAAAAAPEPARDAGVAGGRH